MGIGQSDPLEGVSDPRQTIATGTYVCEEPGCETIHGFPYAGGLLRHRREVHGQHAGHIGRFSCPYKDCKRSQGVGFSRMDYLNEHLRRCHPRARLDIEKEGPPGQFGDKSDFL